MSRAHAALSMPLFRLLRLRFCDMIHMVKTNMSTEKPGADAVSA